MALVLEKLSLTLNDKVLFSDLNCHIDSGTICTVMGPSGCGKSSLLAMITGTLDSAFQYQGRILLEGVSLNNVRPHRRGVGLQLQDHLLFPHMTVAENLAFAVPRCYRGKARQQRVDQALKDCSLPECGDYKSSMLSGGQRARISLMRTLLSEPKALLLDEPFSKLDPELRQTFRTFVAEQVQQCDIPALMVTHDQSDSVIGRQMVILPALLDS